MDDWEFLPSRCSGGGCADAADRFGEETFFTYFLIYHTAMMITSFSGPETRRGSEAENGKSGITFVIPDFETVDKAPRQRIDTHGGIVKGGFI